MSRRASPGRLPAWYKGQLIRDDIGGFWFGHREAKLFKRRGLTVDRKNYDTLTDKERQENINARINKTRRII